MDSYKLRQEISDLQKDLIETQRKKKINDNILNDFHKEKMKYLEEISIYNKQASDAKSKTSQLLKVLNELSNKVSNSQKEYDYLQEIISNNKKLLDEINEQAKIVSERSKIQENKYINALNNLKSRNIELKELEKILDSHKDFNEKSDLLLNIRKLDLSKKEDEFHVKENQLNKKISEHDINVDIHGKKVDALIEEKEFLRKDQSIVKDKIDNFNKSLKDNLNIKEELLKQFEQLKIEIKNEKIKQASLDKKIDDLKNEEKRIKILELRIIKMARDAGLDKELKELMESLK